MSYIERLAKRTSSLQKRAFLDLVDKNWYVETAPGKDGKVLGGSVIRVIRDIFGIPIYLKVSSASRSRPVYIHVKEVTFFEPYSEWVSNFDDYYTWDEVKEMYADLGYVYVEDGEEEDDGGYWYNPETQEKSYW